MTKKQAQIIKEYENVKLVHPSYGVIAKKTKSTKTYVFRVIKRYLANTLK